MSYDLVVIGGGIVGAAAAHRAATLGASVVVIDRNDPGRATDAGAGIVGPALNTRDRPELLEFAAAAARAYPEMISELAAGSADTGYERVGLLAVAIGDEERDQFQQFQDLVLDRYRLIGHPTGHELRVVEGDEARRLYPVLGDVRGAVLDSGAARVDGRRLAEALLGAARAAGATIRRDSVDTLAEVVATAKSVIVAGGAWSPRFEEELGVKIPVEPQRGQIAHLAVPAEYGDTAAWPMLSQRSDQYQVAWPGSRIAVGATRETGSGYDPTTTVRGIQAVLDEAARVSPGLSDAELLEVRVGLRPVTPDLMPVIGRIAGHPEIVVATGHGPTGLSNGPYSGRLAADLALGRALDHDITPFAIDRDFG
ncbi:MAG: NAD(P)/FAD-dependent oxidoreductase [Acidimicrobiales bacterium]